MSIIRFGWRTRSRVACAYILLATVPGAHAAPTAHEFTVRATLILPPGVFPVPKVTIDVYAHFGEEDHPEDPQGEQKPDIEFDGLGYAHTVTFPLDMKERRVSADILYPTTWRIDRSDPKLLRLETVGPSQGWKLYVSVDPDEVEKDTPARLNEAYALSKSSHPDPDDVAASIRFLDWYHSSNVEEPRDPNTLQLQVLLFAKMLAAGREPSSGTITSITDLDSVQGFSELSPQKQFRIVEDLALTFANEEATRELESDGLTFYVAADTFFGQAVDYLLKLPSDHAFRRTELPKAIQRMYKNEQDKGSIDDFFHTHATYAEYFRDVRAGDVRGYLTEWLDALMSEGGFGSEPDRDAFVATNAQDPRLCNLWADYRKASETLHEAWSARSHAHLAMGNDLAIAISDKGPCVG